MIAPIRLRIAGAVIEGEIELPDDLFAARATSTEFLDDKELRRRWHRSARTLARMREAGDLPFTSPRARTYLYKLSDVEEIEARMSRNP